MKTFIKKSIDKYGQDKLIESGIVLLENEREIKTLGDLAVQFCCLTKCRNCPVHIYIKLINVLNMNVIVNIYV